MKLKAGTWRRTCAGTVLHPVRPTLRTPGTTSAISLQVENVVCCLSNDQSHHLYMILSSVFLSFAAINGYVAESLPGLLVAQHQQVRWHLLNVGSNGEYHAVHFHGLPFTVHAKNEHRMGVYNLFPGSPNTSGTPQKIQK